MNPGPYAPPKSTVADVAPPAARHWLRTKWLYLFALAPNLWIGFLASETLLESSALPLASGAALAVLLSAWPLHTLATRRSDSLPWWWDVAFYGTYGMFLTGALAEDADLLLVGFVATAGLCASVAFAAWMVEVRYRLRVYSKARSVVYVPAP